MKREILTELNNIGSDMRDYYQDVTASWKTKTTFNVYLKVTPELISVYVDPKSDIFRYVDEGTGQRAGGSAYIIRPKRPGYPLRFRGGYNARTQPVARYDVGDGTSSGNYVSTYEVLHPGITPREFTKTAQENIKRRFKRDIENALRRGARR